MFKTFLIVVILFISLLSGSCSKKSHPSTEVRSTENNSVTDKKTIRPKNTEPLPKVIIVNDGFAHKSVDGRLYYDVEGHRYWRNKKDGKYYLFNKSMYNNEAFKP
jgi:hypothetical protein